MDLQLSASELTRLARTLDSAQLRLVLSGHSRDRRKKHDSEEEEEAAPVRALAKLSRDELIAETAIVGQADPALVNRLCEAAWITPRIIREWITEREPAASSAAVERITELLVYTYQHGHQKAMIPAIAVAHLLATGVEATLEEVKRAETEHRHHREAGPFDLRALQTERRRRQELQTLLAGMGMPEEKPFRPDAFQLEAVDLVLNQATDVMVSAPTGSGKTWIAIEAIRGVLNRGEAAWYTSPLKALSNDKFQEFGRIFGPENVGIITGDRRINPDAPLKVATTEIYRNGLYDAMNGEMPDGRFARSRLVVFDEVHYLGDTERGVVWEESIIYTPSDARILMLSATVGNSQELADWVAWTRGVPCQLVWHPDRPVPLRTAFVHPNGRLQPLLNDAETGTRLHADVVNLYAQAMRDREARQSRRRPFYRRKW